MFEKLRHLIVRPGFASSTLYGVFAPRIVSREDQATVRCFRGFLVLVWMLNKL